MEQPTTADIIIAFVAVGGLISTFIQFGLSARGRRSDSNSKDADAIESLTTSINQLYSRIDALQAQLDRERIARRVAEERLADLTRRFVLLEHENKRLAFENTALLEALRINRDENL